MIKSKDGVVFLKVVEGKPVGFCINMIKNNIPVFEIEKYGVIVDIYVKKDYRGKKISSEFKDKTFDWFKNKGIDYVSITVSSENDYAHKVYKKWGFTDYQLEMRKKI